MVEQAAFDPMYSSMRFRLVHYNEKDYAGACWILAEAFNQMLSADSTTAGTPLVFPPLFGSSSRAFLTGASAGIRG
ncbi:hypothetical protein ACIBQ6_28510 [Nonomuraea sp. NPDC049655]|uniref:hypothetical protein n=1 Tax=Nonomuraea sp. NPDC049655 TaxID=3364355 RepID=UPI0037A920CB